MQCLSINSVRFWSWSKIFEAFYSPVPTQNEETLSYSRSSPIQVQSNAHLWRGVLGYSAVGEAQKPDQKG